MTKKKSKKKIRKKQKSIKDGFEQDQEEQEKENPCYIKDPDYRLRCKAAIDILMAKLKMINAELSGQKKRTVISQTTSRIKSAESIYAKLLKKRPGTGDSQRKNLKDPKGCSGSEVRTEVRSQ